MNGDLDKSNNLGDAESYTEDGPFDPEILKEDEEHGLDLGALKDDLDLVKKMEELERKERAYLDEREAFNAEYEEYVDSGNDSPDGVPLEVWKKRKEEELMKKYELIQEEKHEAFEAHRKIEEGLE